MDFNADDVGFVPRVAGYYIENTGKRIWSFWRCSPRANL